MIFLVLFLASSTKPCGLITLFNDNFTLNQTNFLLAQENMQTENNGSAMSVSGWISIDDNNNREHPLLKLKFIPNENETNPPQSLSNFAIVSYDNTNANEPFLNIQIAENENSRIVIKENVTLPTNTWLFIAISFDYSKDIFNFYLEGRNGPNLIQVLKSSPVSYPSFFIRQRFELDVGCFTDSTKTVEEVLPTCLIGKARSFNYIFEYFPNIQNLKFLSTGFAKNLDYTFDFYQTSLNSEYVSKDASKTPIGVLGEKSFLDYGKGTLTFAGLSNAVVENVTIYD